MDTTVANIIGGLLLVGMVVFFIRKHGLDKEIIEKGRSAGSFIKDKFLPRRKP